MGFAVTSVSQVQIDGGAASPPTRVRELVAAGDCRTGRRASWRRPFALRGSVRARRGRGQKIGVPTANLVPENELLPAVGIYAGRAQDRSASYPP